MNNRETTSLVYKTSDLFNLQVNKHEATKSTRYPFDYAVKQIKLVRVPLRITNALRSKDSEMMLKTDLQVSLWSQTPLHAVRSESIVLDSLHFFTPSAI